MQQITFAIGHFMEWSFNLLVGMGWMPVTGITLLLFFGLFYWLMLQSRYNTKAKANNSLA